MGRELVMVTQKVLVLVGQELVMWLLVEVQWERLV